MDTTLLGSVADWALVIITLTYAIFTIGIFLSNRKANELTKKQLEDSKKQYKEKKSLEIRPHLNIEYENIDVIPGMPNIIFPYVHEGIESLAKTEFKLVIENVGLGTAKNIRYTSEFDDDELSESSKGYLWSVPINIMANTKKEILCRITHPPVNYLLKGGIDKVRLSICLTYEDLLSDEYGQLVTIEYCLLPNYHSWIMNSSFLHEKKKLETSQEQNT